MFEPRDVGLRVKPSLRISSAEEYVSSEGWEETSIQESVEEMVNCFVTDI